DGEIERVDALELDGGLARPRARSLVFLSFLERLEVGLSFLVLDDVQFREIESHGIQMDFLRAERLQIVIDPQFRNVQENRASEFGRVAQFEILDGECGAPQTDGDPANGHSEPGWLTDLSEGQ